MSDRLIRRSEESYLRAMQMSSALLMVFVEGKDFDEYFYGKICQAVCTEKYKIRRAEQIPLSNNQGKTKSAGGKKSLTSWFEYLEQHSKLVNDNIDGKKQVVVFFLDKDVDDLLGKIITSPHLIYTKYYNIENHIFVEGDLNQAAAVIASHDPQEKIIGDCTQWRQAVAEYWKGWVKLCLFAVKTELKCECNYSNLPSKNNPLYNRLKDDIYLAYEQIIKNNSLLTEAQFQESFVAISNQVDELYAAGEHDMVFKGKWYAGFLEAKIEAVIGEKLTDKSSHKSYFQIIISTLDFNGEWAEHFKRPLLKLLMIEAKN